MKVAVAVVTAVLAVAGAAPSCDPATDPKIAVGGDVACAPSDTSFNNLAGTATKCRMKYTGDALVAGNYASVLAVGDVQYNSGKLSELSASYGPTWGRVKSVTRPAVGNHDYGTSGAADYFAYFGSAAGTPGMGWYSYDVGTWHIVVLNSNCTKLAGGYGPGSTQDNTSRLDDARGIAQFVVGTGGAFFTGFGSAHANSEARQNDTYGLLELTLHRDGYDWRFVPEAETSYTDSGSRASH